MIRGIAVCIFALLSWCAAPETTVRKKPDIDWTARYGVLLVDPAESAALTAKPEAAFEQGMVGLAWGFLLLRAFSSGCAALTGVEAISNGVPAFRKPESRNASITLLSCAYCSSSTWPNGHFCGCEQGSLTVP